ncbi:hypothetical protein T265_12063 [Opisthorchis viverrini]|uniref:DUF7041 domain-containing protein n=1 Tax=Opisthorchis viverrini TaxID=6198 RepID=A0A074Z6Y6_OPIVI|nr:hypothetical protein T265_12063 [Opisthorchis viverrini]KER18995.1 hypothetical protein T265_12063 [Opisthorchis viverrini]
MGDPRLPSQKDRNPGILPDIPRQSAGASTYDGELIQNLWSDSAAADTKTSADYVWTNPLEMVIFAQLEAMFESRCITSQNSRYNHVVGCLPDFIAREVSDLIYSRPPRDPYDVLKLAILSRTAASDEQNLRKLLSGVDVGDKSPSQHRRHMMQLQGKYPVDDAVLKELWRQSLPVEVRNVIFVIEKVTSLENSPRSPTTFTKPTDNSLFLTYNNRPSPCPISNSNSARSQLSLPSYLSNSIT